MAKVLIVEHRPNRIEALKQILEAEDFQVESAATIAAGVERIQTGGFTLVVTGLTLPDAEGVDLINTIRKLPKKFHIPVVTLVGTGHESDVMRTLKAGRTLEEAVRLNQSLREIELRMKGIFQRALDCIILTDSEGKIIDLNPAAQKQFACHNRQHVVGKDMVELFVPPDLQARYRRNIYDFTGSGEMGSLVGQRAELQLHSLEGKEFIAELAMQPVPMEGEPAFAIFLHDITERKEAEEKLRRTAEELARSNRDLDQFASIVSHDLHAPLRSVSSYCGLLQRRYQGKLDEKADQFIKFAVDGTKRMQRLIDDLRAFSRVATRAKAFEQVDLNESLNNVLANLEMEIEDRHAKVTHDDLPTVTADPIQMMQLMQNLIGNAIKYCREGTPEVHVEFADQGDNWRLSVRDNGIGMDPEQTERIFEIFQRLHTDEEEYTGTGIGLAVCKRIVERHGGEIAVKSKPGVGSIFYFTLPKKMPEQPGAAKA